MSQMLFIRTGVFKIKQREMAVIAGVTQTTISRWENGQFEPSRDEMQRIRSEAVARKLKWKDSWFFQSPASAEKPASSTSEQTGAAA